MKVVAGTLTSILDRILGPKLFSLQAITVSVCYAVLTAIIIFLCVIRFGQGYWHTDFLQFMVLYAGLGTLPYFLSFAGRGREADTRKDLLIIRSHGRRKSEDANFL